MRYKLAGAAGQAGKKAEKEVAGLYPALVLAALKTPRHQPDHTQLSHSLLREGQVGVGVGCHRAMVEAAVVALSSKQ